MPAGWRVFCLRWCAGTISRHTTFERLAHLSASLGAGGSRLPPDLGDAPNDGSRSDDGPRHLFFSFRSGHAPSPVFATAYIPSGHLLTGFFLPSPCPSPSWPHPESTCDHRLDSSNRLGASVFLRIFGTWHSPD